MSPGEFLVMIVTALVGGFFWAGWFWTAYQTNLFVRPGVRRAGLVVCFIACLGIVLSVLLTVADKKPAAEIET